MRAEGLAPDEITEALVNMSKNKSPGSDGLTTECYCKFYDCLNHILFKIFNNMNVFFYKMYITFLKHYLYH
jgi:hypothetical protein